MSSAATQKLEPLIVEVKPPVGMRMERDPKSNRVSFHEVPTTVHGTTPDGRTIYQQTIVRASEPEAVIDKETGEQAWAKHPTTGEPLYPKWKKKPEQRTRFIVPNNQGNGNLSWEEWSPASEAELANAERRRKGEAMRDVFVDALVEADISPDQLPSVLRRLAEQRDEVVPEMTGSADATAPTDTEPAAAGEFPKQAGAGRWKLSNGSFVNGKKVAAIAAEAALKAALKAAPSLPADAEPVLQT